MYLGKKSPLMTILGDLGKLSREERPAIGKRGNEVKNTLEAAYTDRVEAIRRAELQLADGRRARRDAARSALSARTPASTHADPA